MIDWFMVFYDHENISLWKQHIILKRHISSELQPGNLHTGKFDTLNT
jgi:hypothetical protein